MAIRHEHGDRHFLRSAKQKDCPHEIRSDGYVRGSAPLEQPPLGEELFHAFAITVEPDDHFAINYQRCRRATVPLIHQLVQRHWVRLNIPGHVMNALMPKILFGCSAVGSTRLMEQNYFFHEAPLARNFNETLLCQYLLNGFSAEFE
jgi:hypothetical protein